MSKPLSPLAMSVLRCVPSPESGDALMVEDIREQCSAFFGIKQRAALILCRDTLTFLQTRKLVQPADDGRPVAWVRTALGDAAVSSITERFLGDAKS